MSADVALKNGFKVVRRSPEPGSPRVIVILVTAHWILPAREWFIASNGSADTSIPDVAVYAFEEWKRVDENFSWTRLSDYGSALAGRLVGLQAEIADGETSRIILMAHSLAGTILKHCLVLLQAQKDKSRPLRESLAGVVFMGTPHCASPDRRQILYDKSISIIQLHGYSSGVKKRLDSGDELTSICDKFDEISGSFPVITLYETKSTKIPGRLKSRFSRIVDQRLAIVESTTYESLMAIDTDHRSIPTLRDDNNPPGCVNEYALKTLQQLVRRAQDTVTQILSSSRRMHTISLNERKATFSSGSSSTSWMGSGSTALTEPTFDAVALEPLIEEFATPRLFPILPCVSLDISRERNKDFFGREEALRELESSLLDEPRVAVIHGIGGAGKSDVALEFIHLHRAAFDAIFWIPADDIAKMRRIFGRIAVQLGLEEEVKATDPHASREIAKAWLSDPITDREKGDGAGKARWLVVFDGAENEATLKEFGPIFCKGSVIITTQDRELAKTIPCPSASVSLIDLSLFQDDEASALLRKLASQPDAAPDAEDRAARELVRQIGLGGYPLAISQVARVIRNKYNISLDEFLQVYTNESQSGALPGDMTTQDAMVEAMRLASLSAQATALLQVCAMLDPDCVQESLLAIPPNSVVPLKDFPVTGIQFADARAELLRCWLVHRNSEKPELWMHRVVQDMVRRQCSDDTFDAAFRTAAMLVGEAWKPPGPEVRDNLKLWNPCSSFLNHVIHLQLVYEQASKPAERRPIGASFAFAWLLSEAACFQTNLGNTAGQKRTLELALALCKGLPTKDTFMIRSDIYHGLGAWANETNHPDECLEYNTLYLDMRLDAVKEGADPNERTAAAWNQYGTALMMFNRYSDAMKAFEESIRLYGALPSETQCPDSLPIVNLAVAKWLTKDYQAASRLLEAGRLAREEAFGFQDLESFRTGRFFHTLGNVRYDQGRMPESRIWHRRALKQYSATLGKTHHRTADVRHRVAQHCLLEKDYAKAGKLIDQALESWNLDPDSFRHEIARTTWLKALQRGKASNPEEKKALQLEAAEMRNRLRPDDPKSPSELTEEDFNDLVAFWSR